MAKISRLLRCLASGHRSKRRICELVSLRFALRKPSSHRMASPKQKSQPRGLGFVYIPKPSGLRHCVTPHPWHSRLLSPSITRLGRLLACRRTDITVLLGCQPGEKTTLSCFFLVANLNFPRRVARPVQI